MNFEPEQRKHIEQEIFACRALFLTYSFIFT